MIIKRLLTPPVILVILIISILTLGYIDYITSYEFGFFMFYFIPIAIGGWVLGPRYAILLSVLSAITWGLSQWYSGYVYSHVIYYIWDTVIHLISFLILGYILAQIHKLLIQERQTSKELQDALNQVKTLSGLLPICAWCKKIRNDEGYWQHLEEYVKTHTDIQFSHGLCQECAAKIKDEEIHTAASESMNTPQEHTKPD